MRRKGRTVFWTALVDLLMRGDVDARWAVSTYIPYLFTH